MLRGSAKPCSTGPEAGQLNPRADGAPAEDTVLPASGSSGCGLRGCGVPGRDAPGSAAGGCACFSFASRASEYGCLAALGSVRIGPPAITGAVGDSGRATLPGAPGRGRLSAEADGIRTAGTGVTIGPSPGGASAEGAGATAGAAGGGAVRVAGETGSPRTTGGG